jgi:molybdopterin converting factor small subunit
MKKEIGLWIDHRKAVIVIVSERGEEVKEITSHMEKHVRYSNDTSEGGASEDIRDRQFDNRLNNFYDAVVTVIRDGDTVQIFGPGEAKGELKKRLESAGFKGHILAIETVDRMTDRQITAKVKEQLRKK